MSSELATEDGPSASLNLPPVNIGTRRSVLARIQTDIVQRALKEAWPRRTYEIHAIATNIGDTDKVAPLSEIGGGVKSLWTHELEAKLLDDSLDLVVHSLKDVPTQLPPELTLAAILPRADPRDALVIRPSLLSSYRALSSLPAGSVIGTSSVRRTAQLRRAHPHLSFANIRGNIGTRLAKLDAEDSPFAAVVLAAAALHRMGMQDRISAYLSGAEGGMLHAVGQGAIGVEARNDDENTLRLLRKIGCPRTTRACLAERSLLRALEGGCSVPVGVETEWGRVTRGIGVGVAPAREYGLDGTAEGEDVGGAAEETDILTMRASVTAVDGGAVVDAECSQSVKSESEAEEFGLEVARVLVARGADKILAEISLNRGIIKEQGGA